jgi:hypothetical protein
LVGVAALYDHHASRDQVTELYLIGDAQEPRMTLDAIHERLVAGLVI